MLTHLAADLRHALRMLRKSPGVSALAIAALALGIGANTAIFSVVNTTLLQPLPYPQPQQLVQICRENQGGEQSFISVPDYLDEQQSSVLAASAAYDAGSFSFAQPGAPPERLSGYFVETSFLTVLGVHPALGADFRPSDDQPGRPPVALISDILWHSRFGADPTIVGRNLDINGQPTAVLGILPRGFGFAGPVDVLEQLHPTTVSRDRSANVINAIGRLRPGISLAAAQSAMHALGTRLARAYPQTDEGQSVGVVPLQSEWTGDVRPALLMLAGAVGLVLLIACADLAHLLLAKALVRRREMAVRLALGAARRQVIAQSLTESLVLALLGAVAGIGVAVAATHSMLALAPPPQAASASLSPSVSLGAQLDLRVLLFALGLALLTGLLFGLAPALLAARTELNAALQQASTRTSGAGGARWFRRALIAGEVALALPLLMGAALLLNSFIALRNTSTGVEPQHLLTARLPLSPDRYSDPAALARLSDGILPAIRRIPGVQAAALTLVPPLTLCPDFPFAIPGRKLSENDQPDAEWHPSTAQTFAAMGIPILRGRGILDTDTTAAAPVVVINERAAAEWWPHQNPIGQSIWIGKGMGPAFADAAPRTIVGVVGDVRQDDLQHRAPDGVYIPLAQMQPGAVKLLVHLLPFTLVVRTAAIPYAPLPQIRQAIWAWDARQPVTDALAMKDIEARSLRPQQFNFVLLGVLAALGLLLAALGVYGVVAYAVAQRRSELGLRVALGATQGRVLRLILGETAALAAMGAGLGTLATLGLLRALASLFHGTAGFQPGILALTGGVLLTVAILASLVPAWRAARLDPARVLRG